MADQLVELTASTRRWHRDAPDVEIDIDFVVLHEPRPVETEPPTSHPAMQRRQLVKAAGEKISPRKEGELRRGGWIANQQGGTAQLTIGGVRGPERSIDARQLLHRKRIEPNHDS